MKAITKFECHEIDDQTEPYRVVLWRVPPGPREDARIAERFDEKSIDVPKSFGSIWFQLWTWEGGSVAQATFAADADAVRCDTITVHPTYRLRGIATRLYEAASESFQGPVVPSENQTPDAVAFWRGRKQILHP